MLEGPCEWEEQSVAISLQELGTGTVRVQWELDNPSTEDKLYIDKLELLSLQVMQEEAYYAYGLAMAGVGSLPSAADHHYLYQGKELENDFDLAWHDFHARAFDAQLGRWHAHDPAYQFASPYVGMGNNPVVGVDPDGKLVAAAVPVGLLLLKAAAIGAGVSAASYTASVGFGNGGFRNWNIEDLGKSMARGALTSVISFGFAQVGLGIATKLAENGEQLIDGVVNVAYQAVATSGTSIVSNVIQGGWSNAFSQVNIGVTDFSFTLKEGEFSLTPLDIFINATSAYSYSRGFLDVKKGFSTFELDKSALSPRFTETMSSSFDLRIDKEKRAIKYPEKEGDFSGTTTNILSRASGTKVRPAAGVNQNGVSFLSYSADKTTKFHESLHAIHGRITGAYLPWLSVKLFGRRGYDKGTNWFETILVPFINKIYGNH